MNIVALAKYSNQAASTRQRISQYIPWLDLHGISVELSPLLNDSYVSGLASGTPISFWVVAKAYFGRLFELLRSRRVDMYWVYGEVFPYLPVLFEALVLRRRIPVVYDIDDAFFESYDRRRGLLGFLLRGKLNVLMRRASICCCGNEYLKIHVELLGGRAIVIPTVVDIEKYTPQLFKSAEHVVVGWIGSPSTWQYVRPYLPVLRELIECHNVRLRVIGAGQIPNSDKFPGMELVDWTEAGEIDEVRQMDVGIMPLPDEAWARGKSGFKLVQYMACGLPVVASPVGVNTSIVEPGINGFLANTQGEWLIALTTLTESPALRARLGSAGRRKAVASYSLQSQRPRLLEMLKEAGAGRSYPRAERPI